MFIFITQLVLATSIGGMALLAAKKMPALLEVPEEIVGERTSWQIRQKLALRVKKSASGFRQQLASAKTIKRVEFDEEFDQAREVDEKKDYWTNIRQG